MWLINHIDSSGLKAHIFHIFFDATTPHFTKESPPKTTHPLVLQSTWQHLAWSPVIIRNWQWQKKNNLKKKKKISTIVEFRKLTWMSTRTYNFCSRTETGNNNHLRMPAATEVTFAPWLVWLIMTKVICRNWAKLQVRNHWLHSIVIWQHQDPLLQEGRDVLR